MEVTEVRIKLMNDPHERLLAFCSVTLDGCFVVRDLKIIQGTRGAFVAMPSRKLTDHCPRCRAKNHLRARYCNDCGAHLDENRACAETDNGRAKLYADIAHPINSECRESIQERILAGYEIEVVSARAPDYVCTYDDYGEDRIATLVGDQESETDTAETGENRPVSPTPTHAMPAAAELPRTFRTSDDRTHRIDRAETPSRNNPQRAPQATPHQVASRSGEEGFGEGLA